MKKVALVISIFTMVILLCIPKEQSEIEKLSVTKSGESVISKHLKTNEKTSIETGLGDGSFTTPEEYLLEAKQIRRCNTIPKTENELDVWLNNANEVGEPEEYIEDVLIRFERCLQFNFTSDDFLELLFKAIKLGSDNAVAELWHISDREYFQYKRLLELSREDTITQRVKFHKLKYQLSERVALAGGEQAILRLVKGYQNYDPESGKPNSLKAIAFADFGLEIIENNDIYLKLDFIKQRISQNMNFQELQQAQLLTESLLSRVDESGN